jgi:pyridoxine kinase
MAHVLSVQDLSCLGKCSLTVALPVLSAMGCTCTPLPTAVLSSHTAFEAPYVRSMTQDIVPMGAHLKTTGVSFDAVTVGYLACPEQAAAVEAVLDLFDAIKIIDPAMGDHGRLYSGLTDGHIAAMAQLCKKGNILLPNLTEAALLTGLPYREDPDRAYCEELLDGMLCFGADAVILTGACATPGKTGFACKRKNGDVFFYEADPLPGAYHGTGDLFASVFAGAVALGKQIPDAATLAAKFVEKVIAATPKSTPFGVNFESCLPWLWAQI